MTGGSSSSRARGGGFSSAVVAVLIPAESPSVAKTGKENDGSNAGDLHFRVLANADCLFSSHFVKGVHFGGLTFVGTGKSTIED